MAVKMHKTFAPKRASVSTIKMKRGEATMRYCNKEVKWSG